MSDAVFTPKLENMQHLTEAHIIAYSACAEFRHRNPLPNPADIAGFCFPMRFPKRRVSGRFEIEDTAAKDIWDITNARQALLMNVPLQRIHMGKPTVFHALKDKKGNLLTTDTPMEIYTQWVSFRHMKGDVLIGGLGLGMCAEMINRLPGVTSVTVVEKELEIVRLMEDQLSPEINIIHGDIFKYLKTLDPRTHFDSAYFDIWYATSEDVWQSQVVPLYRLARRNGIETLGAWAEFEMEHQMMTAAITRAFIEERHARWKPYKVFCKAVKRQLGNLPRPLDEKKEIIEMAEMYVTKVGTPEWESTFKWEAR